MTDQDQQYADIVEHATNTIVGDKQELTVDEMKRITWLVAEILTCGREQEPTCDGCKIQGVYVKLFCLSRGDPTSLACPVWREQNRSRLRMGEFTISDGIIKTNPLQPRHDRL